MSKTDTAEVRVLNKQSILDASTAEILAFAKEHAGLTFAENIGRTYAIQQIFDALDWDAYRPEDGATHVVVKFPITDKDKHPYQGGFNGVMFTIKRGVEAEISIGQYNTIVEAASARFKLQAIGANGEVTEGSPASKRIPMGALDMTVIQFLNKGTPA